MNPATPDNGAFMIAGYVVAGIVYLGYTLLLVRRARALQRRRGLAPRPPARPGAPPPPAAAA